MTLVSQAPQQAPEPVGVLPAPGVEQRAIDATLACIARHGLSKTTIDDIARQGGFSRATLYRYFGNRGAVIEQVVTHETQRVVGDVIAAAEAEASLGDAVTAAYVTVGRELAANEALRFVADFEPELLLPHLTFAGGDTFLRAASVALAPALERFVGERATRAAEWIVRVGLMLWLSPTAPVSLVDEDAMRAYVAEFVVPALGPAAHDAATRTSSPELSTPSPSAPSSPTPSSPTPIS